jgi:hypothetical protein
MTRGTLARRYLPLVAALGVQVLIIAVAPSKAPGTTTATSLTTGAGPVAGGGETVTGGPAADAAQTGTTGGTGGTAGGGPAARAGAKAVAGAPPGAVGDISHCVAGRQFDPAIAWQAPPCAPGVPGAAYPNNGGDVYEGVTKDTITIVDYVSNYGAEVNAILEAQGLLVTADQAKIFDKAVANFVNKYFQLYGRKFNIITYQGQCTSVPPDVPCLKNEIDRVLDTYHPYIFFWNTTLCSECYAEVARKKVVAFGGVGFSDEFSNAHQPYFYSAGASSSRIELAFAEWWCKQLSSKNVPSRRVKWATTRNGAQNPAQNFNGQPRVLGVISTNDPDNEDTVKNVLYPALKRGCNEDVQNEYFYAQDINTAAQQVEAGIAAMADPRHPATDVLCLCDPVAPAFLYEGEQNHNYYPENVIATDQGMDYDQIGQSYMEGSDGSPSLACPTPSRGCEYDHAFGLSTIDDIESVTNNEATRVFKAGGGIGNLPMQATAAVGLLGQYLMMADLVQNTGPNLTPDSMLNRAPALGAIGGGTTGHPLLQVARNNVQWIQDARIVYWNRTKRSPWNAKNGTYTQIEGPRFNLGQYPTLTDGPPLPY